MENNTVNGKVPIAHLKNNRSVLPELPIPKGALKWLMICIALSVGWHIPHTPIWAVLAAVLGGAYTFYCLLKEKPLPHRYFRILLVVLAVLGILITYKSYLGRDPGMVALILLSVLKAMEINGRRDFMFIVFLCYFLIFGNFLYDQSIEDLAFTLLATIMITATLLRLNHPPEERKKAPYYLRFSFRLIVYALPFTILLFFLFPRTRGPLWNFSQQSMERFESGFSDTIEPGQIAELAQSRTPAFQVEFPRNDMPQPKDLYFRGLVLWFTNGQRWSQGIMGARYRRPGSFEAPGIVQQITLQPHNQRWLFGLDWPVVTPPWSGTLPGRVFQSSMTINAIYRYMVLSRFDPAELGQLDETQREWALQLPDNGIERILELGQSWRDQATNDEEILQKAERYFKENGFTYSLNPGTMDPDTPMEDFLFNKQRGFCEHFAGAFTLLMRCAGVPARVVLGYQGGEFNQAGKYLLVRQSDAHAWSEVWIENKGWQRVDPTAWIAPERILYGMDVSQALSAMGNINDKNRTDAIQNALKPNFFSRILKFFKQHWDNINYKWDVWIISYDNSRQHDFFRRLGFKDIDRLGLFAALVVVVPLFFFIISFLLKRQTLSTDPLLRLYLRFCQKMAKAGLQRLRWEGPLHFQERAITKFPNKRERIEQITALFIELRYGRTLITKPRLKELKKQVSRL